MALPLPIPRSLPSLPPPSLRLISSTPRAFRLGDLTINGVSLSLVSSVHSDQRMTERDIRECETILSACRALASNLSRYSRLDEIMVNVTNRNLSFVLGLNRPGYIQIKTVINKSHAYPKHGTQLEQIAL
jgi:hypothetical protein